MAADKAPSVDQEFVRNVGTIEIVALRCKTVFDEPPPRMLLDRTQKPHKDTPRPKKHSSPEPSAIGGLLGIFDGACDGVNLDGRGDVFSMRQSYMEPEPDSGESATMEFDSVMGERRPASHHLGHSIDPHFARSKHVRFAQGGPSVIGRSDGHGFDSNYLGNRGRRDMQGGKYIGQTGPPKDHSSNIDVEQVLTLAQYQFLRYGAISAVLPSPFLLVRRNRLPLF